MLQQADFSFSQNLLKPAWPSSELRSILPFPPTLLLGTCAEDLGLLRIRTEDFVYLGRKWGKRRSDQSVPFHYGGGAPQQS